MQAETSVPINPVIASRRSPRSFVADHKIDKSDLLALVEAARWAPSAFNGQPWRFFIGQRGDEVFAQVLSSLGAFNQSWAKNSSVLILLASTHVQEDGTPYNDYLFDCGLAVSQLVHEAHERGLVVHQMAGFDKQIASKSLEISEDFIPVVVIAIGKQDSPEKLAGKLAEREVAPRERLPLETIVIKGLPL